MSFFLFVFYLVNRLMRGAYDDASNTINFLSAPIYLERKISTKFVDFFKNILYLLIFHQLALVIRSEFD